MSAHPYVSSRSGRLPWLLQRVSAIGLIGLAFSHFFIQHFTTDATSTGLATAARFSSPYWQGYYVLFVVLVLYHAVNGTVGVIADYAPKPILKHTAAMVLWLLGAYFAFLGVRNIVHPAHDLTGAKQWYVDSGFPIGESRGNPPILAKTYDFADEPGELALLQYYLVHHVAGYDPAAQSPADIFGVDVNASSEHPADLAGKLKGEGFDAWCRAEITKGLPKVEARDRGGMFAPTLFSSTYEFAVWAQHVRHTNHAKRNEKLPDAPEGFVLPAWSPAYY